MSHSLRKSLASSAVLCAVLLFPALLFGQESGPGVPARYMVHFRDRGNHGAAVRTAGGLPVHEFAELGVVAAWLPEPALQGLARNPHVVAIEVDSPRYLMAQSTPYGISMVQADQVSEGASVGNVKVCVIDSGYHVGHEDLQDGNISGYPSGWDTDGCGHGSHVAGTISALANSVGVVGVLRSGSVPLHIVKVFGSDCVWAYASDLIDALNRCRTAGAKVVSMSLGGDSPSSAEETAFNNAWNAGVLSVAAAGNAGNTAFLYPASYSSVVSVAAVDSSKVLASFSQRNSQVDLAAPGVAVLSTVPFGENNSVTVSGVTYAGTWIQNAARSNGTTGILASGGLCTATGAWSGRVVLCQRGTNTFFQKVQNVQASGGIAAVIYNNVPGGFSGTLGAGNSSAIPAIGISQADGQFLAANGIGQSATVVSSTATGSGYEAWSGTSMATPHVAGVAALVWSHNTSWTNAQLRSALESTAEDRGTAGRDDSFGHGIVQAKAALDSLNGGPPPPTPTPTPVAPTATPTPTPTPVAPTATPTRTPTPVAPTATPTPTPTPVAPTATPTRTPTPVAPTATPTRTPTPVPPTATATQTPTPVAPTATPTRTSTPVPPTATATQTPTPVAPTATPTRTATPVPPTATATRTPTPPPPFATATPTPGQTPPRWYLHNRPIPPVGNTNSQANLPLNQTAPTASTLFNYDADRDGFAGRLIQKGSSGAGETDLSKYQNWLSDPLASSLTTGGTVRVTFYSAIKDFSQNKPGSVTAFLRDYNGSSYTNICSGSLTQSNWQGGSSTWVSKTLSFNCGSYTIPAGRRLEVKLVVGGDAGDDMWFAYDTTTHASEAQLP